MVAATVVFLFGYLSTTVAVNHGMMVLISVFAAILGIASLTNAIALGINTIKTKEMKKRTIANRFMWSILSILYFVFIVTFKFYNFWSL